MSDIDSAAVMKRGAKVDQKLFKSRTKLLRDFILWVFATQGFIATLQNAGVIRLTPFFRSLYEIYKAAIPDNIVRAFAAVGIQITPGSADYMFVFLAFTVPLVTSVYVLHPTKPEWEAAGRTTSWRLSFWLFGLILVDAFFAAQNVVFSAVSPAFNEKIASQKFFGIEIRFLTIGSIAAMSLYRLWADLGILPERKQHERRAVIFRTVAILAGAALVALINRFFAL